MGTRFNAARSARDRHGVPASKRCYSVRMRFIEDEKLPTDVVREEHSDSCHALCCLECGYEALFDPRIPGDIGRPLLMLLIHPCAEVSH
jgi:hypothetical protein